ncbi:hypothetical protein [Pseudomonas juntendi]|uniref:hypothetical protein n=1 Tax=Pseudomonas juntendi TaxID=2666183 RepID=UPI001B83ACA8|nr:hypothetical protein [Pseudomonas juntendi]MBR7522413.1 hypothetical protein [Pseudomonas juntendi]
MSEYTGKHYLRCTQRFKEIVNEIGHRAGFVRLKKGQDYARKKGFSALLDQVVTTNRIEIEGDYKEEIDKLNRIIVNHTNNLSQVLNNVGHVSLHSNGKTYQLKDYILEYYKSAEPALKFIAMISESDPFYKSSSLDLIDELIREAEIKETDTGITFKSSYVTDNVLALHDKLMDAIITLFEKTQVYARTLKLSETDKIKLETYEKIFKHFNSLNKYINDALFKKDEPSYAKVADNLKVLKRTLDNTNEKENDN